ncbi:ADP-ribosylation factor-like protein 9 [Rhinoraja longicauda]
MLERVYRAGLLAFAAVLGGGIVYAAWGRWFRGESPQRKEDKKAEENSKQILVVGLDGAGKTSFLHSLATSTVKRSDGPTKMFNSVRVNTEEAQIEFLEIGGGEGPRQCWSDHLPGSRALVYVVDSADHNRMSLAKHELHQLIRGDTTLPVVVLANKQDIKGACTILEIHERLSLEDLGDERKLFLIGTHVSENGTQVPASVQDAKELIAQLVI